LVDVTLDIVPSSGGNFSVQNDATVGIDCLVNLVLSLLGRNTLLSERGLCVDAAGVRVIR
jgi:hypothetical protein